MKDDLSKKVQFILIGLLGLSVILTILFYAGVVGAAVMLNWGYVLLGITAVAALVFPIIILAQDPKRPRVHYSLW